MTPFQIIASFLALFTTLYYAPGLWRKDIWIRAEGYFVWAVTLILWAVSMLGVR